MTLADLRIFAVSRSLFKPVTLRRAIARLGFVLAEPIRAPARAQDLTLRHRVNGYRAGDLERLYAKLPIEEDTFVNYGLVSNTNYRGGSSNATTHLLEHLHYRGWLRVARRERGIRICFEAYTPAAKRWFGYVAPVAPQDRVFARELEAELERLRCFLGIETHRP